MINQWQMALLFIGICSIGAYMTACASNPHRAKKIDAKMESSEEISGDTRLGIKDGNMVVQKKVQINDELRRLQNEVYQIEDHVYGSRKYGSKGLYGSLKTCRSKLTSKKYGGTGRLMWTEPIDRITDKEDEWNVGVDEKEKIIGISQEFLLDRIQRFKSYKKRLQKRQDEYEEKLEICDAALESKKFDLNKKKKLESNTSSQEIF